MQNIANPVGKAVFFPYSGVGVPVGCGEEFVDAVEGFSVPNKDVVGMVEIIFGGVGVGGNQFFAVAECFEWSEGQAAVYGRLEVYQDAAVLFAADVFGEGQALHGGTDVFGVQGVVPSKIRFG